MTIDLGGRFSSQLLALINMVGNFAAAATPPLVGILFENNPDDWSEVLLMFAGIYFAAGIFWVLVDPNKKYVGSGT